MYLIKCPISTGSLKWKTIIPDMGNKLPDEFLKSYQIVSNTFRQTTKLMSKVPNLQLKLSVLAVTFLSTKTGKILSQNGMYVSQNKGPATHVKKFWKRYFSQKFFNPIRNIAKDHNCKSKITKQFGEKVFGLKLTSVK